MNTKNRTRKGFTTVELVIVIAVIAILATVLIPTFSNMIEKANLSVDTQNVRNMNMVLMTYITDGEPEHFGVVRDRLIKGGYKTGVEFKPKTEGYKYLWYSVDNVILLVDDTGKVVYPEDYKGLEEREVEIKGEKVTDVVDNVRLCFDLSLPAAIVTNNGKAEEPITATMFGASTTKDLDFAVHYTFETDEPSEKYDTWLADFYITYELPTGYQVPIETVDYLYFAGRYQAWHNNEWTYLPVNSTKSGTVAVLQLFLNGPLTYKEVCETVVRFDCGLTDIPDDHNKGAELTVELRLTNPDVADGSEYVIIGIYTYTFQ